MVDLNDPHVFAQRLKALIAKGYRTSYRQNANTESIYLVHRANASLLADRLPEIEMASDGSLLAFGEHHAGIPVYASHYAEFDEFLKTIPDPTFGFLARVTAKTVTLRLGLWAVWCIGIAAVCEGFRYLLSLVDIHFPMPWYAYLLVFAGYLILFFAPREGWR